MFMLGIYKMHLINPHIKLESPAQGYSISSKSKLTIFEFKTKEFSMDLQPCIDRDFLLKNRALAHKAVI